MLEVFEGKPLAGSIDQHRGIRGGGRPRGEELRRRSRLAAAGRGTSPTSRPGPDHVVGRRDRGEEPQRVAENAVAVLRRRARHPVAGDDDAEPLVAEFDRADGMATFSETPTSTTVRTPMLRSTANSSVLCVGDIPELRCSTRSPGSTPISSTTLPPRSRRPARVERTDRLLQRRDLVRGEAAERGHVGQVHDPRPGLAGGLREAARSPAGRARPPPSARAARCRRRRCRPGIRRRRARCARG